MHLKSLTGLRWYAAVMVYLAHTYHFDYFGMSGDWLRVVSRLGHMGVSLFFVLSGFVLAINYPPERCRFRDFYSARFARIYPAYILGIFAAIPMEWIAKKGDYATAFLSQAFLVQGFFGPLSGRFNDVGWTLSVEAFFYLCFPFIILYAGQRKISRMAALCGVALVLTVVQTFLGGNSFAATYRFPSQRLFEFMTGILMGLCYTQCLFATAIRQRTKAAATGAVFCVMLMVLSPLLFKNIDFLEKTSFILYGLISAAFLFLIANLERIRVPMGMFTHPLVVVGGEISFSFYLFHNLLLRYMEGTLKVFREDSLAQWALGAQVTTALVVFIATVIISWLVFTCVETPGRKIIRRFLMPSKSPEAA